MLRVSFNAQVSPDCLAILEGLQHISEGGNAELYWVLLSLEETHLIDQILLQKLYGPKQGEVRAICYPRMVLLAVVDEPLKQGLAEGVTIALHVYDKIFETLVRLLEVFLLLIF